MSAPPETARLAAEYAAHAARKEEGVRAMLEAHGLGPLFGGLLRCPVEGGFRTQASFRARDEGGALRIAGVDPRTGPVPLEDALWTLPEEARPALLRVAEVLRRTAPPGVVTGFELRLEHGSLRPHVAVAARREAAAVPLEALVAALLEEVPGIVGAAVPSRGVWAGGTTMRNRLGGRTVLAHPAAFFQTNARVTPPLAEEVSAGLRGARTLVDLYCGVGMHSVLAAEPETVVEGADSNHLAIASAAENAALHGLVAARYHRVTAERFCQAAELGAPDAVVVNPSRFGCGPGVAEAVSRWRPRTACLVSCSPASHLRDLLAFAAAGMRPLGVRCFDMFPFSDYLESVTFFEAA